MDQKEVNDMNHQYNEQRIRIQKIIDMNVSEEARNQCYYQNDVYVCL